MGNQIWFDPHRGFSVKGRISDKLFFWWLLVTNPEKTRFQSGKIARIFPQFQSCIHPFHPFEDASFELPLAEVLNEDKVTYFFWIVLVIIIYLGFINWAWKSYEITNLSAFWKKMTTVECDGPFVKVDMKQRRNWKQCNSENEVFTGKVVKLWII